MYFNGTGIWGGETLCDPRCEKVPPRLKCKYLKFIFYDYITTFKILQILSNNNSPVEIREYVL